MNRAVMKCAGCGAPQDRTSTNCPYCGRLYPFENDNAVVLYADDRAIAHVYSAGVITTNDARRMMGYDEFGENEPIIKKPHPIPTTIAH